MNDWVMHLDAASALLSSFDSAAPVQPAEPSPMSMTSAALAAEDSVARNFPIEMLSEGEKLAFQFFLTQYTYCFINAAASLGLTSHSAESIRRTRAIFHSGQSKLKDMLGCEDWVLITMLDIAALKDWKQQMQNRGTLSLRELTRRADVIESRLTDGLAALVLRRCAARSRDEEQQDMITTTFATGSLVFIHVVVSGFYPNLPEIRQAVLQALEALEYMRQHSVINIPSWPYCVSGCLALESQYSRFRALSPSPKAGAHPLVLTKWTLEILEQCWKVRTCTPDGEPRCGWVTAMNHLGTRLLLL